MKINIGETLMADALRELKIPFEEKVKVCDGRRWHWDFWVPLFRMAIEIDGMYQGSHGAWGKDYEKQNYGIMVQGIRVVRFTAREVERGKAKEFLQQWLSASK